MTEENNFQYSPNVIRIPFLLVFCMWLVYWIEIKFGFNFSNFGIFPRTITGLKGILFSPFIHSGIKHLANNSVPTLVFVGMLFYFYKPLAWKVLIFGGFFTGFFTWCIGVKAYHIGISGWVYLLFGFIFFSGVFRRYYRLIAVSMIVIFLYGSMFWYVFPMEEKVSWEGHLSGLLSGFFLAIIYRKKGAQKVKHQFVKTEFDTWFDDDGNFNPPKPEVSEENELKEELE